MQAKGNSSHLPLYERLIEKGSNHNLVNISRTLWAVIMWSILLWFQILSLARNSLRLHARFPKMQRFYAKTVINLDDVFLSSWAKGTIRLFKSFIFGMSVDNVWFKYWQNWQYKTCHHYKCDEEFYRYILLPYLWELSQGPVGNFVWRLLHQWKLFTILRFNPISKKNVCFRCNNYDYWWSCTVNACADTMITQVRPRIYTGPALLGLWKSANLCQNPTQKVFVYTFEWIFTLNDNIEIMIQSYIW